MLLRFTALVALALVLAGPGAEAQVNVPLMHFPSSEAYGYGSYINIQLGSNAQAVSVLVDTGSSTLAVPPTSCSASQSGCSEVNCVPQCPLQSGLTSQQLGGCAFGGYDSSTSTSAAPVPLSQCSTPSPANTNFCGFSVSYGQSVGGCCGMQGFLVQDTLTLGGLTATPTFGQIQQVQSSFQEPPSAGIFGFAYDSGNCLTGSFQNCGSYGAATALTCQPSALSTFLTANNLADVFSMCFGSLQVPGVLTLGGTNSQFYSGAFQYTPITPNTPYYTVTLEAVGTVSGSTATPVAPASISEYANTILDSGTSQLLFPNDVFNALSNVGAAQSCSTDSDCASLQLYVALTNIPQLTVPGMYVCGSASGTCTLNTAAVGSTSSNPILGYPLLSSYYVTFERAAFRAGFATLSGTCGSTCSMHAVQQGCIMQAGCAWNSASSVCAPSSQSVSSSALPASATATVAATTILTTTTTTLPAGSSSGVPVSVAAAISTGSESSSVTGSTVLIVTVVPAILGLVFILSFVAYRRAQRPAPDTESRLLTKEHSEDSIYAPSM